MPKKVWKSSSPSTYEHISSLRPKFVSRVDNVLHQRKALTFSNVVVPDKKNNTLTTSVMYSQGSDIYEIDFAVPLQEASTEPVKDYGDAFEKVENTSLSPKFVYQGETVSKMAYLDKTGETTLLSMSKNGSLAWFKEGIKVPIHIVQELMGPSTSYASIHSLTRPGDLPEKDFSLAISDFGISNDTETIVKSQSNGDEEDSILKIIDNAGKPGEILRTVHVPGTTVTHTVRFFDNHIFASCSDDNILRFWDTRTSDKPLWVLGEPKNGKLTSFDCSQVSNNLFVTGFSTGIIKLWDARAAEAATTDLTYRQNGEDPIQNEIASFYHAGGDSVVDVQFSATSDSEFLTVGGTGNIYHWSTDYSLSKYNPEDAIAPPQDATEESQTKSLRFLHKGGSRRSPKQVGRRNTAAWHPVIENLVGTVDDDSLISIYKSYTEEAE